MDTKHRFYPFDFGKQSKKEIKSEITPNTAHSVRVNDTPGFDRKIQDTFDTDTSNQ